MILAAGFAGGHALLADMRRQSAFITALDSALGLLEAEIERLRPLPECFYILSQRGPGEARELFSSLAEACGSMTAAEAWEKALADLNAREREILLPLAMVLGARDAAAQCAEIAAVRKALDAAAESLRADIAAKGKSYPLMGLCAAGIAAALIM